MLLDGTTHNVPCRLDNCTGGAKLHRNNLISKILPTFVFRDVLSWMLHFVQENKCRNYQLLFIRIQPSKTVLLCLAQKTGANTSIILFNKVQLSAPG